jgi:polysaccharide export outer membrane protein
MRVNRCLAVLLAALAVAGCARRAPSYQPSLFGPRPVAQAQVYQAPMYRAPAYQTPGCPAGYQCPPAYQTPAYQQAPVYQQTPVYQQAPVYQPPAPVYQQPAPVYQAPAYQTPSCTGACGPSGAGGVSGYTSSQPAFETPYTLDAGDRLRITVFGQDGLTNSYAVDAAGSITMPLIGPVPARGLTPDQLSQSISERLRQGYIREPHVALEIEAYRPFFILGEVTSPGQYPYVANMTVETAVAIAGGFGPRADKSKVGLSRTMGGQTTKATVPLTYPLRPGDTIRIPERWF